MKIFNSNSGRLGNSIFRLLANIVFLIVYDIDGTIIYNQNNYDINVNDNYFVEWSSKILLGEIPPIDKTSTLYFNGYYQHDKIYLYFKKQIIDYINNHPELLLLTDRNDFYKAINLSSYNLEKTYKTVVHLRLEDFLVTNQVLDPLSICKILDKITNNNDDKICFVVNQPTK